MLSEKNENIKRAYRILQVVSKDEKKRLAYEARQMAIMDEESRMDEAREEGIKEGIKKGIEEEKKSIAIKLLDVLDDKTISEKTNLSLDEVKYIRKEHNA